MTKIACMYVVSTINIVHVSLWCVCVCQSFVFQGYAGTILINLIYILSYHWYNVGILYEIVECICEAVTAVSVHSSNKLELLNILQDKCS